MKALPFLLLLAIPVLMLLTKRRSTGVGNLYDIGRARISYELEPELEPVAVNEEVWEWTDYKGNKRKITVHRKVSMR